MTVDKSLKAKFLEWLIRVMLIHHHLVHWTEKGADTAICKKEMAIETDCVWILIITAAGPNGR